jgi:hypothetical protein
MDGQGSFVWLGPGTNCPAPGTLGRFERPDFVELLWKRTGWIRYAVLVSRSGGSYRFKNVKTCEPSGRLLVSRKLTAFFGGFRTPHVLVPLED